MRRCYLVCYDVRDPKRLRRVHKLMKGYGEAWQYSVFFCVLKAIDRARLQAALETEINLKEDQAILVDLGPDEGAARGQTAVLGPGLPAAERGTVVV